MSSIADLARILSPEELAAEQAATLASQRRRYGVLAKMLFLTMDVVYGRSRTFSKFKVLEIIARVPYQSWEHVAYIAMTHTYSQPRFARRVFEFIKESRDQQDNEQWHLLILEELVQKQGIDENFLLARIIPQVIAFFYYHVSWLLYVIQPRLSYELNADFEDHAEHEYMGFVKDNPVFDQTRFESDFENDYGHFATLGQLFRRIGVDERMHKLESLDRMEKPRF